MKLQILLNRYTENETILGQMLQSIEEQDFSKTNYEVLIGNDGGEENLSEEFFKRFSFPLRYFSFPHRGVCRTRNNLLDLSEARYLIFADSDDVFHKKNAFTTLINAAEESNADIIDAKFLQEHKYSDGIIRANVEIVYNINWLQGKMFRRDFLIQNGIRFPDEQETSGDMYFLWLAFHLTDKIMKIPDVFYTWKYYEKSVTRSQKYYFYNNYRNSLHCYMLLNRNLIKRNRNDLLADATAKLFSRIYFDYNYFLLLDKDPKELIEDGRKSIEECVMEFHTIYEKLDEKYRKEIFVSTIKDIKKYDPDIEFQKVLPWVKEIINKPA